MLFQKCLLLQWLKENWFSEISLKFLTSLLSLLLLNLKLQYPIFRCTIWELCQETLFSIFCQLSLIFQIQTLLASIAQTKTKHFSKWDSNQLSQPETSSSMKFIASLLSSSIQLLKCPESNLTMLIQRWTWLTQWSPKLL